MTALRSTARPMPQEPRPSDEAIQAARDEAQAIRDAGPDDYRNYVRGVTPGTAIYGDPIEDLSNLTPRERALRMREKARAALINGDNNDAAINGR